MAKYMRSNFEHVERSLGVERRRNVKTFLLNFTSAIYLFEYHTRSSNNLSQLANQTFLLKYEAHYFYWDVFFFGITGYCCLTFLIQSSQKVKNKDHRTEIFWRTQKVRGIHKFVKIFLLCFYVLAGQKLINDSIKTSNNSI